MTDKKMCHTVLLGDALERLRMLQDESVDCCVTSPPYYGLRDYDTEGQIGLEKSPEEYVERLVAVFREVRRVLRNDGTLWIVIGDSYATRSGPQPPANTRNVHGHTEKRVPQGYKYKELIGVPWMLAFALRAEGWYLRQDIIWQKTNCMPESVRDRCTKSHEYIFLFSKQPRYFFNAEAISEDVEGESTKRYLREQQNGAGAISHAPRFGGEKYGADAREETRTKSGKIYIARPKKNKRDVWPIATAGCKGAHFAVFPEKLADCCILAGCPDRGVVLDPFCGSGTTGIAAKKRGRGFVGVEINPDYRQMALERIAQTTPALPGEAGVK